MSINEQAPAIPVRRPRAARRRGPQRSPASVWVFAAPGLIVYLGFVVYPALRSFWLSFTDWDGISDQLNVVGLGNYRDMFSDPVVRTALKNNLLWAAVTIIVPAAVGLALAIALNRPIKARPLLRTIFYSPAVLPLVSVGVMWGWLYQPNGVINSALKAVGLDALAKSWLGDSHTAIWATMVPACWVRVGFPLLLYLAALQTIPDELYEAAQTEGASAWQQFRYITFPSLRPTHLIVIALSVIEAVKVFDLVWAMTNGGPGNSTQVMGTWMYFNVFQSYHAGYGAAMAVVITGVAIAVGIPYVWTQTKE